MGDAPHNVSIWRLILQEYILSVSDLVQILVAQRALEVKCTMPYLSCEAIL